MENAKLIQNLRNTVEGFVVFAELGKRLINEYGCEERSNYAQLLKEYIELITIFNAKLQKEVKQLKRLAN